MRIMKKYTVMLVPFNQERVLRFKFTNFSLFFIGSIFSLMVIFAVLSLFSDKNIFSSGVRFKSSYRDALMALSHKFDKNKSNYEKASDSIQGFLANYYPALKERYKLDHVSSSQEKLEILLRVLDQFSHARKSINQLFTVIPSIFPVVGGGKVNSPFGTRIDPFTGTLSFHTGVDIFKLPGVPIRATANGKVYFSGWNSGGYGFLAILKHSYGFETRYAHMRSIPQVKNGEEVKQGQIIGYVGTSGRSIGYHLHYEVHYNGKRIDPVDYLFLKSNY